MNQLIFSICLSSISLISTLIFIILFLLLWVYCALLFLLKVEV